MLLSLPWNLLLLNVRTVSIRPHGERKEGRVETLAGGRAGPPPPPNVRVEWWCCFIALEQKENVIGHRRRVYSMPSPPPFGRRPPIARSPTPEKGERERQRSVRQQAGRPGRAGRRGRRRRQRRERGETGGRRSDGRKAADRPSDRASSRIEAASEEMCARRNCYEDVDFFVRLILLHTKVYHTSAIRTRYHLPSLPPNRESNPTDRSSGLFLNLSLHPKNERARAASSERTTLQSPTAEIHPVALN